MSLEDDFALLSLQIEWGADEALLPDPLDRLRPLDAAPVADRGVRPIGASPIGARSPITVLPTPQVAAPVRTPAERALAAAGSAETLDDLRAAIAAFDACPLRDTAAHLVFAEGNRESPVLLVGEPPGREEDRGGHPFAGPEGQLLDQMLASIGLTRAHVMATPLVPWRPPGGRPVSPSEKALLLPFLHRLIVLLDPARVMIFGGLAAKTLLPPAATRRKATPDWVDMHIPGVAAPIPTLAVPSLSDMLKTPVLRRDAWAALRRLRRALDVLQTDA